MSSQMDFIFFYILLIILLLSWIYHKYENRELVKQIAKNGHEYLVRRQNDPEDQLAAANLLVDLGNIGENFVNKLHKYYNNNNLRVKRLYKRFNKYELSESLSSSNQTSYSVNKGENIVMCIRSKKNNKLIDTNTLLFVLLHELGHLMSISIGHNDEFWTNFKYILLHAIEWKIYKYEDYMSEPKGYCGISITDTPLKWTDYVKLRKEFDIDSNENKKK